MTITQVITELPAAPDPATDSASVFSDKAAAYVLAQKNMVPQLNAANAQLNATVVEVNSAAQAAAASQVAALSSQQSAAASAASAIAAPGTNATSSTSLAVGSGTISVTVQAGKSFVPGMWGNLVRTSDRSKWMLGYIDSYNSGTGSLVLIVAAADVNGAGTGPYTDWTFSLGAARIGALAPVDLPLVGPSIRPSLLADFANSKRLPAGFVYTMPDTLAYTDAAGILRSAAPGVPAFDHDPQTGRSLGISMWESRTNSIRNNTMQGAAAGTPGTAPTNWTVSSNNGLSSSIVGSGTEDNIAYIDVRFFGTASSIGFSVIQFETSTGITAASGQNWAVACYIKMVAGSTSNISTANIAIDENTSGGAFVAGGSSVASLTSTLLRTSRQSYVRALSGGGTVARMMPHIKLFNTATGSVDITLRVGLPTAEQGAFATPAIITSGSAVTRSASNLPIATSAFDFNAAEGTAYVEFSQANVVAGFPRAFNFNDGTPNNVIQVVVNGPGDILQGEILVGGAQQFQTNSFSGYTGAQTRVALAYKANDCQIAKDGGANATDTLVTIPAVTTLTLGNDPLGSAPLNGWLSKFAYYPRRLVSNELVALSTL